MHRLHCTVSACSNLQNVVCDSQNMLTFVLLASVQLDVLPYFVKVLLPTRCCASPRSVHVRTTKLQLPKRANDSYHIRLTPFTLALQHNHIFCTIYTDGTICSVLHPQSMNDVVLAWSFTNGSKKCWCLLPQKDILSRIQR